MPTTFAHYSFGGEVRKRFSSKLQQLIGENADLFNIGLHGPDILFYYKALKKNPVKAQGSEIHKREFTSFLENARSILREKGEKAQEIAYLSGFICHYMLDSQCHPYIREREEEGLDHAEIEAEFDRLLMEEHGLNPLKHKPVGHIKPTLECASVIAKFFHEVDPEEILRALKSMRLNLSMLVAPGGMKRLLVATAFKLSGNYQGMIGLLLKKDPEPGFPEISRELKALYLDAVEETAELIEGFVANLSGGAPLSSRFARNFG